MQKKYYIDENPFDSGDIKKWNLLVDSLDSKDTTIEAVEELINNTDAIDRMKINDLLNKPANYFKCQQTYGSK
jgi:hypothetical protein